MIEFNIDCRNINSAIDLHTEIKDKLSFPNYYGNNFSALDDCLREFLANYTNHENPNVMNHIVFNMVGYENALSKIGENDFAIFLSCFEDAIELWKGTVIGEVRLVA